MTTQSGGEESIDQPTEATEKKSPNITNGQPQDNNDAPKDTFQNSILSVLDVNKISDWKNTLSGALDDQRLFWGLFVLTIFYIFYILVNAIFNDDEKDEDSITELCKCNPKHRWFYIFWFSFCSFLWGVSHIVVGITDSKLKDCFIKICNCGCLKGKCKCDCLKGKCNHSSDIQSEGKQCCSCLCRIYNCLYRIYNKFKSYIFDKEKLSRYEFHLWTQYCELYVVGITKNNENFNFDHVEQIIKETFYKPSESQQSNKAVLDTTVALSKYHKQCDLRYVAQAIFFVILKLIQLIAQFAVIPLLIIQMYDTYAFLCFTADSYCSTSEEYNLHLDQTAFTFGFYAALMTSLLSTLMIQWNPWPEMPSKKPK